ncbi:MAG: MarR family transcriptional regulator [bacterium]
MAPTLRDTPALTLLRAIYRAQRRVREVDGAGIALHGLSESEFDVVMTLGNTHGLRMCEIAARTLTSPANVTRVVKELEKKGLVTRTRGTLSDREVVTSLTSRGEDLFERAYPAQHAHLTRAFDAILTRGEQAELAALLVRLASISPRGEEPPTTRQSRGRGTRLPRN